MVFVFCNQLSPGHLVAGENFGRRAEVTVCRCRRGRHPLRASIRRAIFTPLGLPQTSSVNQIDTIHVQNLFVEVPYLPASGYPMACRPVASRRGGMQERQESSSAEMMSGRGARKVRLIPNDRRYGSTDRKDVGGELCNSFCLEIKLSCRLPIFNKLGTCKLPPAFS